MAATKGENSGMILMDIDLIVWLRVRIQDGDRNTEYRIS